MKYMKVVFIFYCYSYLLWNFTYASSDAIHFPQLYNGGRPTPKILFILKKPNVGPQTFGACERPIESDTFTNCSTEGRQFPAYAGWCECKQCHLKLALTCHSDGNWYANAGVNVCDPSLHKKCGYCKIEDIPATLKCLRPKHGYMGEKRTCTCRKNCVGVSLLCDKNSKWKSEFLKACNAVNVPRTYITGHNMYKEYKDSIYTYMCQNGYTMTGSNVVSCIDGDLNSRRPQCKPQEIFTVPVITTTTTVTPPSTTSESSTKLTEISTTILTTVISSSAEALQDTTTTLSSSLIDIEDPTEEITVESDQDINSDYSTSNNIKTKNNKFPLTIILAIIFVILFIVLVGIVLFKLSKHYVLVVQCGSKTYATKPGYTNVKGNNDINMDCFDEIEIRNKN